ncbi:hypothetical protein DWU98_15880 [Dyella monticola]|uniref:Uncharacterized protein n=1 Tax=Dyella monticola TaxID=1927958 RepID=A0A370WV79_9GAMM|nr:hypothetical protein [Dyella monticola]RDS79917.1 hypothetical protein DWU98_15880 [Dyella monticola]
MEDKKRAHSGSPSKYERPKKLQPQVQPSLPVAPLVTRGRAFTGGIEALARGGSNTSVFTKLDIPYKKSNDDPASIKRYGTFSTREWISEGRLPWTQGLFSGNPGATYTTAYYGDSKTHINKLVPSAISLRRATVESQAIKYLADDTYAVKEGKRVKAGSPSENTEHWGGLALGSFLEDVTGSRALNIHHVGSALRASVMAAKWKMKSGGVDPQPNFGKDLLESFPQLGKAEWSNNEKYGASKLREKLDRLSDVDNTPGKQEAVNIFNSHVGLAGSIPTAHVQARKQAKARFEAKFKELEGKDASALGEWWKGKTGELEAAKNPDNLSVRLNLRDEYLQRKMDRHAIVNYPGPRGIAKHMFKAQGVDKSDPDAYRAAKRTFVDKTLRDAGLAAQADKAQRKWAHKDKFAQKLGAIHDIARNEHLPLDQRQQALSKLGSWWEKKATTTDLTKLDASQHKALRREYVAKRNLKGNGA